MIPPTLSDTWPLCFVTVLQSATAKLRSNHPFTKLRYSDIFTHQAALDYGLLNVCDPQYCLSIQNSPSSICLRPCPPSFCSSPSFRQSYRRPQRYSDRASSLDRLPPQHRVESLDE